MMIFYRLLWYWQRARRGWSDDDLWDLDWHFLRILATALPALAARSPGYPCRGAAPPESCEGCDCKERWQADLWRMARLSRELYKYDLSPAGQWRAKQELAHWLAANMWHLWM